MHEKSRHMDANGYSYPVFVIYIHMPALRPTFVREYTIK